jgi:single-stranded DNA-binding protein
MAHRRGLERGHYRRCRALSEEGRQGHIEGQLETRKYEKDGRDVYVTEVVLRPFRGELTMLDAKGGERGPGDAFADSAGGYQSDGAKPTHSAAGTHLARVDEVEDEIPF